MEFYLLLSRYYWFVAFQTTVTLLYFLLLFLGKTEFGPDEDAHVVGDCIKVIVVCPYLASMTHEYIGFNFSKAV